MTLDFDGTRVTLTAAETQAILHHISELRRLLEFGDDIARERDALQARVRQCIVDHTRVDPQAVAVDVSDDGSRIVPLRLSAPAD